MVCLKVHTLNSSCLYFLELGPLPNRRRECKGQSFGAPGNSSSLNIFNVHFIVSFCIKLDCQVFNDLDEIFPINLLGSCSIPPSP